MSIIVNVENGSARSKWCTVSFSCPVEIRDRLNELAEQAGWARGRFLYHLLAIVLPEVEVTGNPFDPKPLPRSHGPEFDRPVK